MILRQDIRDPLDANRDTGADLDAPLARAIEAACDAAGKVGPHPWRFYILEAESASAVAWLAARGIEPLVGAEGSRAAYEQWRAVPGWIAVTCLRSSDATQSERDREASLTAVQRATLSLWSDNIPCNWVPDLVSEEHEFYALIGADPAREEALGIVLYGHPERRHGL